MIDSFRSICRRLFQPDVDSGVHGIVDAPAQFEQGGGSAADMARRLNAAFLILLGGEGRPHSEKAAACLQQAAQNDASAPVGRFYLDSAQRIIREIKIACRQDPDFAVRLKQLAGWLEAGRPAANPWQMAENIWRVFFPEGVGLRSRYSEAVESLREKRAVRITRLNPDPIRNPARQILFSSNVLLTLPAASPGRKGPDSEELQQRLRRAAREAQLYWYDHPIHIGVEPHANELLYGLAGLQQALTFERRRGSSPKDARLSCILSVSVTHEGLHAVARPYIEAELSKAGSLDAIEIFVFTETDTRRLIKEVLAPAAVHFLNSPHAEQSLAVFGVDGEYGRHYSFLKAMAAFWQVFVQPAVKGTFKIDLDQVFPQPELVGETGSSAFEHFTTPLWGARGLDSAGETLELGMIAGALVNESDIGQSLFTPDVDLPRGPLRPDEYIFFSRLPQAVSTRAEMMTRYGGSRFDGTAACIQRVHVTGGTNGILVDSLRRHRPFTPSFVGRAEDQAYLLSVLSRPAPRLAYVHKDGLIMRHDKEAFAREAIAAAEIGRMVGDFVRMLTFSAYADVISNNRTKLKEILDPFTGCFISQIPITVSHLRFCLAAAGFFSQSQDRKGLELVQIGCRRLAEALEFIGAEADGLAEQYKSQRHGWDLYYDTLDAVEQALAGADPFAAALRNNACGIVNECRVKRRHEEA